jgi:hypothetical protein
MSLLLAHALVSFFHLIMKWLCCFCLCSGLRLGSTFQLGNRQEVPREPREGPEHLGRRRVPSNNRYSGKVESPSSSCLPSERLSGTPRGPGAPHPSRHRCVPRLVPRDVLEAQSGRLGRPRAMRTACATLQERLVGRSVQSAGPPRPAQSARPPLSTVLFTLLRAY